MTPEDFAPLEISRYELRLRALESCNLPPFLGSTIRGAFGHALRRAARAIDGRDCNGCSASDPCSYHYLFETPVPPDVPQLRGQREAPVPFILSPPVVENPIRRVWRVPAAPRVLSAAVSEPSRRTAAHIPNSQSEIRNSQFEAPQSAIRNPQSESPQSEIRNPQSAITSVIFPDAPRRFRAGDTLSFDLILIGRATEYLKYVVLAIDYMARAGLGANRARFELKEVLGAQASHLLRVSRPLSELIRERLAELHNADPKAHSSESQSLKNALAEALEEIRTCSPLAPCPPRSALRSSPSCSSPFAPDPSPFAPRLRLRFLTPTRVRVHGDLQTELSFELLVRNLLRRISMLSAVHGRGRMELDYRGFIERAGSVATLRSNLRWWDLERYTNRQNGKLKVGGVIGEVEYDGEAKEKFLPLIVAGELLNIGTGTSFGLGSYRILKCGDLSPLSYFL